MYLSLSEFKKLAMNIKFSSVPKTGLDYTRSGMFMQAMISQIATEHGSKYPIWFLYECFGDIKVRPKSPFFAALRKQLELNNDDSYKATLAALDEVYPIYLEERKQNTPKIEAIYMGDGGTTHFSGGTGIKAVCYDVSGEMPFAAISSMPDCESIFVTGKCTKITTNSIRQMSVLKTIYLASDTTDISAYKVPNGVTIITPTAESTDDRKVVNALAEVNRANTKIVELEEQITNLTKQRDEIMHSYDDLKAEYDVLLDDKEKLLEDKINIKAENPENSVYYSMSEDLRKANAELEEEKEKHQNCEIRCHELEAFLAEEKEAHAAAQKALAEANDKLSDTLDTSIALSAAQAARAKLQTEAEKLTARIKSLTEENTTLKMHRGTSDEVKTLRNKLQATEDVLKTVRADNKEKDSIISGLKMQIKHTEAKLNDLLKGPDAATAIAVEDAINVLKDAANAGGISPTHRESLTDIVSIGAKTRTHKDNILATMRKHGIPAEQYDRICDECYLAQDELVRTYCKDVEKLVDECLEYFLNTTMAPLADKHVPTLDEAIIAHIGTDDLDAVNKEKGRLRTKLAIIENAPGDTEEEKMLFLLENS